MGLDEPSSGATLREALDDEADSDADGLGVTVGWTALEGPDAPLGALSPEGALESLPAELSSTVSLRRIMNHAARAKSARPAEVVAIRMRRLGRTDGGSVSGGALNPIPPRKAVESEGVSSERNVPCATGGPVVTALGERP